MEDRKLVFDSRIDCRIANPAVFRAAMQLPLNRGINGGRIDYVGSTWQKLLKLNPTQVDLFNELMKSF